ncbi:unnamed protein product [Trifolium pratense]|uniref:Uncharacterized protein n=1 Tax=Trifolium pratense TaxID=57577 RepID=A0ACB0IJ63_TRIPR|nr:unnamed protein product [Trifolium pratense]
MMQTLLQDDRRASESNFGLLDQPTASTSTSYNSMNSNSISTSLEKDMYNQYNCAPCYPTTKKRVIGIKRVYSTRTHGRSGPLRSLARKLGRFKVRTVVVEVTPNK